MKTKVLLILYDFRGEFQSHREHPVPPSHLFHSTEEEELALGRKLFSCSTVCKHIFQISPDFSISESFQVQMRLSAGPDSQYTSYFSQVKCLSAWREMANAQDDRENMHTAGW